MRQKSLFYPLLFLFLGLMACQNEEITSMWVPKESTPPPKMAAHQHKKEKHLQWTRPKGWTEKAAGSMRVGSFSWVSDKKKEVDISVISLSGKAGGLLANVNRWRRQIELDPINETALKKKAKKLSFSGLDMTWVEFDNQHKKVIAVIFFHDNQSWFVKMTGASSAVKKAKPGFRQFLKSLKFHHG